MICLGTKVMLDEKLRADETFIGLESKIFEIFDIDVECVSIRSVPNGTIIIHGLSRNDVVVQHK